MDIILSHQTLTTRNKLAMTIGPELKTRIRRNIFDLSDVFRGLAGSLH